MSIWNVLFASDLSYRADVELLQKRVAEDAESADFTTRQIQAVSRRLDRLELVQEALFARLEEKGLLEREEFARSVMRLDLADGFEDGHLGPDRTEEAPACPFCMRPRNPKRTHCLYCGEEIRGQDVALAEPPRPVEYTRCIKCFKRVRKDEATSTVEGMVCKGCQEP